MMISAAQLPAPGHSRHGSGLARPACAHSENDEVAAAQSEDIVRLSLQNSSPHTGQGLSVRAPVPSEITIRLLSKAFSKEELEYLNNHGAFLYVLKSDDGTPESYEQIVNIGALLLRQKEELKKRL